MSDNRSPRLRDASLVNTAVACVFMFYLFGSMQTLIINTQEPANDMQSITFLSYLDD